MKNQAILATLTIALLSACGGSSDNNTAAAAIRPADTRQPG
ncbi:hypothetical protein [uncultured Cardiobacterium sp.]|nr:hypothetical protein [uncultured Cardiobacterium sp.]